MRRTVMFVALSVVAIVAIPVVGLGQTTTFHGGSPSDIFTTTDPGICADVDTFGEAPILPTDVTVPPASNLLVTFSWEMSGLESDTELLISFTIVDGDGEFVAGMGEWGVSNDPRLHDSKSVMWSFDGVAAGEYDVFVDARTDPVPGPRGGGNTNNNPRAFLEHCALAVVIVPAVS